MAKRKSAKSNDNGSGANLGFEATLWAAADKMRNNMDAAEYIRRAIIEADLVDCMVALSGQLFYSTQSPVCLWFLARSKKNGRVRDRRGQPLFIDARRLGKLIDRVHRELTDEEIQRLADTYHAWRGDTPVSKSQIENPKSQIAYADIAGFCKSATTEEIAAHDHVLTPGRYVGAADVEEDDEPFDQKMQRMVTTLNEQFAESARLEKAIRLNLAQISFRN